MIARKIEGAALPAGWQPGQPLPSGGHPVSVKRRPPAPSAWIVWDGLCQAVRADGLDAVRAYLAEGDHGVPVGAESVMLRTPRGTMRRPRYWELRCAGID